MSRSSGVPQQPSRGGLEIVGVVPTAVDFEQELVRRQVRRGQHEAFSRQWITLALAGLTLRAFGDGLGGT